MIFFIIFFQCCRRVRLNGGVSQAINFLPEVGFFEKKSKIQRVLSIDAILHIFQTLFVRFTGFWCFFANLEGGKYTGVSRTSFDFFWIVFTL